MESRKISMTPMSEPQTPETAMARQLARCESRLVAINTKMAVLATMVSLNLALTTILVVLTFR